MTPKCNMSGYKAMWLFAMFDLPTDSKKARRDYTRFRKLLLSQGFTMLQFSVYARFCPGEDSAVKFRNRLKKALPAEGQVRIMAVTDRQFGKMEVFQGKKSEPTEGKPSQLMLF